MRKYSDAQILRIGAITIVVAMLVIAAAMNLSKFPGLRGSTYQAEFSDASGLRKGNMVLVGGMRSGRVKDLELKGDRVLVTFEVKPGVEFGKESRASVEVLNLLGEKYLNLTPAGDGQMAAESTIPLDRTESAYDIVGVLGDLTSTTERIDVEQLKTALDTVGSTLEESEPALGKAFDGISRLSSTIASRDAELQTLLESSKGVTELLNKRSDDLVSLMKSGTQVFDELHKRKQAVHRLLVNARAMADELHALAAENKEQIGPALRELDKTLTFLNDRDKQLRALLNAYGPYADILGNIIGTGPWFDAYVVNLLGVPTGEFVKVTQS
ncbi:MCE family protein [Nocardioides daejeonensis]|uniref:MCE family protein n=1 Tax=Nocardioides daejeonensis TaxID=1046556 RepID=UPI000D7414ED|nr:MlaD family protein [Nocardioides daejeonensis]